MSYGEFIGLSGPNNAMEIFGVTLIGVTPENGVKLLLTLGFIVVAILVGRAAASLIGAATRFRQSPRTVFWARQVTHLVTAAAVVIGVVSIWFDEPTRLTTAVGLVTAGLAFAMQRVVSAIAGYFVILRGDTFNVGDRIVMGGVRGDVLALGFMQTTVMEMGQPASVQNADPAVWIHGRQFTGRIVTISNANIFDEPVYNYSREFPFIFEEMVVPVHPPDGERAEAILTRVGREYAADTAELGDLALERLETRYFLAEARTCPKVFWRLTDNWLELSLRFVSPVRGARDLKDQITRQLIAEFAAEKISIASASFEIVGAPPLQMQLKRPP